MKCKIPEAKNTYTKLAYATLKQLTENEKTNHFQTGDIVFLTDKNQLVMYDGINWIEVQDKTRVKGTSNIEMTAYDINKQLIAQLPVLEDWTAAEEVVDNFLKKSFNTDYMLLCKDISYYTIFQRTDDLFVHFSSFGEAVLTCASDIGKIVTVDYMEETKTVEIWVRKHDTQENLCMILFDCHDFIVTYQR